QALEAGMRVPLEGFLREALAHFGIAPAQLTPNGWRMMAGFLVLCHLTGVPPSLAVFRRFFLLSNVSQKHKKGWYFFRSRDSSDLRFTGMPHPYSISFKDWKHEFFFLSSPEPWPCAMEWREPSKSSLVMPVLTGEENQWAAKLLRAYGGAAVDLNAYLTTSNLAAAMAITTSKGMYPSAHDRMKTMLAEKAAAQASASAVKAEPCSNPAGSPSLCGEKRVLEEANDEEGLSLPVHNMMKCMLADKAAAQAPAKKRIREEASGGEEVPRLSAPNTPLSRVCSPPPGFSGKRQHIPSRHDGDTTDWEAARELLQGAVSPPLERAFAASAPSEVVKSSYAATLQVCQTKCLGESFHR
uniref:Transposase (putative) gypsy type domain-containing protein n=1 Tax=Aegilops tauschii subsp. strangulata TaxID=200361 RepID=A0A453QWV6_AEGTS